MFSFSVDLDSDPVLVYDLQKDGVAQTDRTYTAGSTYDDIYDDLYALWTDEVDHRLPAIINHASTGLALANAGVVTSDADFEEMASIVSKPDFFAKVLLACMGQILGEYSCTVGAGQPQVQICQASVGGSKAVVHGPVDVADTSAVFALLNIVTAPGLMTAGYNRYTLEARLNGGTELKFRDISFGLLEAM